MKNMMFEKDQSMDKQKQEWAQIYGNMKNEIEDLKKDNKMLNGENERLIK